MGRLHIAGSSRSSLLRACQGQAWKSCLWQRKTLPRSKPHLHVQLLVEQELWGSIAESAWVL